VGVRHEVGTGDDKAAMRDGDILLGRFRLDRQIGRGGFARVFLCTDLTLERRVAIKILDHALLERADEHDFLARFRREARAVAALDHPNILGIHDYGEDDGTIYLVMPFIEGGTLHERLTGGRALDPATAGNYLRQVAAALDYAHRRGIVHRDIKPQNMLLRAEDDRLLLADFGIAKVLGDTGAQTRTGAVGTIAYMAPEQFRGEISPALDIYALGCVLFQMLTGRLPFVGSTEQMIFGHLSGPVPSLAELGGGRLPATLQQSSRGRWGKTPPAATRRRAIWRAPSIGRWRAMTRAGGRSPRDVGDNPTALGPSPTRPPRRHPARPGDRPARSRRSSGRSPRSRGRHPCPRCRPTDTAARRDTRRTAG
jgi:serine/threonine protein kinase